MVKTAVVGQPSSRGGAVRGLNRPGQAQGDQRGKRTGARRCAFSLSPIVKSQYERCFDNTPTGLHTLVFLQHAADVTCLESSYELPYHIRIG